MKGSVPLRRALSFFYVNTIDKDLIFLGQASMDTDKEKINILCKIKKQFWKKEYSM